MLGQKKSHFIIFRRYFTEFCHKQYHNNIGFVLQDFGGGGGHYKGGLCDKLLEISIVFDRANVSQLQDSDLLSPSARIPLLVPLG